MPAGCQVLRGLWVTVLGVAAVGLTPACSSDGTNSGDAGVPGAEAGAGGARAGSGGASASSGGARPAPTGGTTSNAGSGGTSNAGSGGVSEAGAGGAAREDAGPVAPDPCIAAGTCPPGEWLRRELPGMTSDDTVQTVVNDPARPSDFYAFVGSNGGPTIKVFRSVDFGDTWEDQNRTAEITGSPWGASIDPNPRRDRNTPPTLWAPSGYGAFGAWKSVDGGVTWVRSTSCDAAYASVNPFGSTLTDLYHVAILPDDPPRHVLATYHYSFKDKGDGGFGETWDGGGSWVIHPPPEGVGTSHYVIPISGTTWAVIAQDNNGQNGIWRTTTAGRVGGTEAAKFRDGTVSATAWKKVDSLEHAHGSHQNVVRPDGTIFVTGWVTGARSTDHGATWEHFTEGSWAPPHQFEQSAMTNLVVTDRYVYTTMFNSKTLARASAGDPVGAAKWTTEYCTTPEAYEQGGGPFGMATTFHAGLGKWVIVAGSPKAMWKYVEQ